METKDIIQKSQEWHEIRKGKLTGSCIWKLMGESRSKYEALSDMAKTYILEKIAEKHGVEVQNTFTTPAMQWGNDYEPLARKWYSKIKDVKVLDIGFIELPMYEKFAGGSPDGLVEYKNIIEIKCPYNPANHIKHILIELDDFKKEAKEYYWQMQFYMACLNVEYCDFISFDPRVNADWGLHIKKIDRNEEDIKRMNEKIETAIEFMKVVERKLIS